MSRFKLVATVVGLFVSGYMVAQDTLRISLDEALETTLTNNKEVTLAKIDEEIAQAKYRQTNAIFLPQVHASYTGMVTNNPLNAFGFKLQQQSITPADFNPDLLNDPGSTQDFMTKIDVLQPILSMEMVMARKAAHQQVTLYTLKTQRTKEYLTFEIQKGYQQVQMAHEAVAVLEESLRMIKAIERDAQNRFEKGYMQKADVLQVTVQAIALESKLAEAKSNVSNASDYLSLLMGKQPGVVYQVDSIKKVNIEVTEGAVPENRADFKAMEQAIEAQDMMVSSKRMAFMPRLNAFGTYQINDKEAFGFGSQAYLAGAQLSWTLFNGTSTRNTMTTYKIERDKLSQQLQYQKEQSQLELNKTKRQLQDATFAIQQYETAVKQASEALRMMRNRYEQGLVTTSDVLMVQSQEAQQRLYYIQALFQYNTTVAYLQFLTTSNQ